MSCYNNEKLPFLLLYFQFFLNPLQVWNKAVPSLEQMRQSIDNDQNQIRGIMTGCVVNLILHDLNTCLCFRFVYEIMILWHFHSPA